MDKNSSNLKNSVIDRLSDSKNKNLQVGRKKTNEAYVGGSNKVIVGGQTQQKQTVNEGAFAKNMALNKSLGKKKASGATDKQLRQEYKEKTGSTQGYSPIVPKK